MTLSPETRADAARRFAELGYPTRHDEEWRFTNVGPIAQTTFTKAKPATNGWRETLPDFDGLRLVFVNGRYDPELSTRKLPAGVAVTPLAQANGPAARHLARYAAFDQQPFVAQNTAEFEDGAFVEVSAKLALSEPIHLVRNWSALLARQAR